MEYSKASSSSSDVSSIVHADLCLWALPLAGWSMAMAFCSCWLLFSIAAAMDCVASSSDSHSESESNCSSLCSWSESESSESVSCRGSGGAFLGLFLVFQGIGCGARICLASQSCAKHLNNVAVAPRMSLSVLAVDPLSLWILSACCLVGSPA